MAQKRQQSQSLGQEGENMATHQATKDYATIVRVMMQEAAQMECRTAVTTCTNSSASHWWKAVGLGGGKHTCSKISVNFLPHLKTPLSPSVSMEENSIF